MTTSDQSDYQGSAFAPSAEVSPEVAPAPAPGNRFDPNEIAHDLAQKGFAWADADAAFKALDDVTKTVLSETMLEHLPKSKSVAEAETRARADRRYRDHLVAVAESRKHANRATVSYKTYQAWIELMRTAEANKRAEMRL